VFDSKKPSAAQHFKVSHSNVWEKEVSKELETNLRLRRNFEKVNAGFISSFFNLVPAEYDEIDSQVLLNFSEAEFENNKILKSKTRFDNSFFYGVSQTVLDKLNEQFPKPEFFHSGTVFLNSIPESEEAVIHLNLYRHNLEIAVIQEKKLLYYNLFETLSGEDILFYTLFAMQQLDLDTNKIPLKCYGQLLPDTKVFQIFKKYVRFVSAGSKDESFLENFTLFNLPKCASFQAISEEKK
jgi:hypothetical protein